MREALLISPGLLKKRKDLMLTGWLTRNPCPSTATRPLVTIFISGWSIGWWNVSACLGQVEQMERPGTRVGADAEEAVNSTARTRRNRVKLNFTFTLELCSFDSRQVFEIALQIVHLNFDIRLARTHEETHRPPNNWSLPEYSAYSPAGKKIHPPLAVPGGPSIPWSA